MWLIKSIVSLLFINVIRGQTREERLANKRLPADLRPYHYVVTLRPDLYDDSTTNKTFQGTVDIYFECVQATDEIILNVRDYMPTFVGLSFAPENNVTAPPPEVGNAYVELENEFYVITVSLDMVPGARYQLTLSHEGYLSQTYSGLYLLSYQDGAQTRWLAASSFGRSQARAAFPCFDEPEYKATFDVILERKIQYRTISSTSIVRSEQRPDDWIADIYVRTPVISTSFLALVVCDFQYRERVSERGVVTRIWARRDQIDYTERVWTIATSILDWYENYMNINYPLQKLDHVALPGGTNTGGFGLALYAESLLLFNDRESDILQLMQAYFSVSHEIAHQWFGSLVTCSWWDDLWLDEALPMMFGFAPFRNLLRWQVRRLDANYLMRTALRVSHMPSAPPIVRQTATPQDAPQGFDPVIYLKGGALFSMIRYAVGEGTFRQALQRYVTKRQYGVATTDEFWTDLQEQVDADNVMEPDGGIRLDVRAKFDAWARQEGIPLVLFDRSVGPFPFQANLNQTRFMMFMDTEVNQTSPWGYKWQVPITIYHEDEERRSRDTKYYLPPEGLDISTGLPPANKLLLANVDQIGLYRMLYDNTTQYQLLSTLGTRVTRIPVENRGALIEDMFRISRAFRMDETFAMEHTKYLARELQWMVWRNVIEHIQYHDLMFQREAAYGLHEKYWRGLVDYVYRRTIIVRPDDIERRMLRQFITFWACNYNNLDCLTRAYNAFNDWWQAPITRPMEPDQHLNYMCAAVRTGEAFEWELVYALYRAFGNYRTETRYLAALACTRDYYLLERYFAAMEDGTISNPLGAVYLSYNSLGKEVVWRHLKDNWNNSTFGDYKRVMLVAQATPRNRPEELEEFEDFVFLHPPVDEQEERTFEQVRSIITSNIQWMELNAQPMAEWLEREVGPSNGDSVAPQSGTSSLMALTLNLLLQESQGWSSQPPPEQLMDTLMQLVPQAAV